jgi:hypothetical protein
MDPMKKQRVGYLLAFTGLNMGKFLEPDIEVFTPFTRAAAPQYKLANDNLLEGGGDDKTKNKIKCVGILENFSFGGGVGDPLCMSAYISAENAQVLAAKLKTTLDTNVVKSLAWWICNFDEENKTWFEEAHPMKDPVVGQINAPGGKDLRIAVAQEATKVAPNIDVNVYNLYVEVIPAANSTYAFNFATSAKTKYVRNWGLKVGKNAAEATK